AAELDQLSANKYVLPKLRIRRTSGQSVLPRVWNGLARGAGGTGASGLNHRVSHISARRNRTRRRRKDSRDGRRPLHATLCTVRVAKNRSEEHTSELQS